MFSNFFLSLGFIDWIFRETIGSQESYAILKKKNIIVIVSRNEPCEWEESLRAINEPNFVETQHLGREHMFHSRSL